VLEATTSKILITSGEYLLFLVFYFKKFICHFRKIGKNMGMFICHSGHTLYFWCFFDTRFLSKENPKILTLILGGKGGSGVKEKKLTNGFYDPENPYNDGLKK